MSTLKELNELGYNTLNDKISEKINNCYPLSFTTIGSHESFSFLLDAWSWPLSKKVKDEASSYTEQQSLLLGLLRSGKSVLIPKGRQVGESLATSIYLTHEAYVNHKRIIVVNPARHQSETILTNIRYMLNAIYTRDNNKYTTKKTFHVNQKNLIKLSNHQYIEVFPSEQYASALCSHPDIDIIYISEAGHINNCTQLLNDLLPKLNNTYGQVIISSSYNGEDEFFYPLLPRAEEYNFTVFPMNNTSEYYEYNWPSM